MCAKVLNASATVPKDVNNTKNIKKSSKNQGFLKIFLANLE
jgi:hypothetical protein